ncbi:MAG: hypothetical protein J6O61_02910 [Butyrivibrio sp.]|uniref:PHP domain-containing protein n=1 Tax=Butyrivibrio sp. TaxID=28121 RepID=UPI001B0D80F8|nr:PHP domain-containing protein [Butyrivibrio sp.]MBO6239779.1 hypothetical protein [Butyrivibrio sp.]
MYIFETHLHTIEGSACSSTPGEKYIDYMKKLGYSGIIVTDHFFNGNSAVPKNLPWEKKVDLYCKGYEHVKAATTDDFTVLFGVEYNFEGDEYLIYGLDKNWLLSNPDIMEKDRYEVYETVHEAGAIMIHAHPYRERDYLKAIHLTKKVCDGAEVYNASNPDWQNALGYRYAAENGMRMAAGSDIHNFGLKNMGGMGFSRTIKTIEEYVEAFMAGEGIPLYKSDALNPLSEFKQVDTNALLTTPDKGPSLEVIYH